MRISIITDNTLKWKDYLRNQAKWNKWSYQECICVDDLRIYIGDSEIIITSEVSNQHRGYRFDCVIVDKYIKKHTSRDTTNLTLRYICPFGEILYTSNGVETNLKKE